jgi:hypothetical protein
MPNNMQNTSMAFQENKYFSEKYARYVLKYANNVNYVI